MRMRTEVARLRRALAAAQPGQVFVLATQALLVLVGIAALAVDVGDFWPTRSLMHSAADAASIPGTEIVWVWAGVLVLFRRDARVGAVLSGDD